MADFNELTKIEDRTAEFDPADAQQNKAMGILAYIGPLVLVPIFGAKESKFARFHANQGLVLLIANVALSILGTILGLITWVLIFGWLSWIPSLLLVWPFQIFCVVLCVLGIVAAAKGQCKELPIVGKIKILK